jgi:putative oxidoreductase
MEWLSRYERPAYAAFRIVVGFLITLHGLQKFGILGEAKPVMSQLWVGGVIETACGILVCLGLFTRLAAFLLAGTMAVAYFQFHWPLKLDNYQWLPTVNHGEGAVLYCFAFLLIATRGPGAAALDRRR